MRKAIINAKNYRSGINFNSTCNCGSCNCNCGSQSISKDLSFDIANLISNN